MAKYKNHPAASLARPRTSRRASIIQGSTSWRILLGLTAAQLSCGEQRPGAQLISVQPSWAYVGNLPTEVTIRGDGLFNVAEFSLADDERARLRGATASIGGVALQGVRAVDSSAIVGVAQSLPRGAYSVEVTLGNGKRVGLRDGFTVVGDGETLTTTPENSSTTPEDSTTLATASSSAVGTEPTTEPCTEGAFGNPRLIWPSATTNDRGPALSADRSTLLFSRETTEGIEDLFQATRSNVNAEFGQILVLDELSGGRSTTPVLSPDKLRIYFASDRSGSWDLWAADRLDASFRFGNLHPLIELNGLSDELRPYLSADEQVLYFESNRSGQYDVWRAERNALGDFVSPEVMPSFDTPVFEGSLSFTPGEDACYFLSAEPSGALRLFQAFRDTTNDYVRRTQVQPLSAFDMTGFAFLSADGNELVFGTHSGANAQLWQVSRECER